MAHKIVGQVVNKINGEQVLLIFDNDNISVAVDVSGKCHLIVRNGDLSTFLLEDYKIVLKEHYE